VRSYCNAMRRFVASQDVLRFNNSYMYTSPAGGAEQESIAMGKLLCGGTPSPFVVPQPRFQPMEPQQPARRDEHSKGCQSVSN
jgi:hypothetical protein